MAEPFFDSRRYFTTLRQVTREQQEIQQLQTRMVEQSQILNDLLLDSVFYDDGYPIFPPGVKEQIETRRMLLAVLFNELERKRDMLFMLHMELGAMEKQKGAPPGRTGKQRPLSLVFPRDKK